MKHIIILGDGMADWPVEELGGKTLLQAANTPYMDKLAKMGRNGKLITVAPGFHPGSEVANMSVLGYNLPKVYEGRGPLEAASIGIELANGEFALRCNIVCIEGDTLKNHSSGHITTEEADILVKYLQEKLGNERIHFHTGVQYRHLLVIKGGDKRISCTPPHDIPGKEFRPYLVKADVPEAEETAALINELIFKSQELLKEHPLNKQRASEGKDPSNSIWPWGGGYRPKMEPLSEKFPQVKSGSVISAVDLIRG
ncbi:MAG: phosphoglycerate mutase, partial [Bacteroidaceae bacterium]|nr:phosphoglycerate mutase [Bacteroidaceae bacterium]